MRELETLNTTNLVIAFSDENNPQITFDGVSEFASDGIIALYNSLVGAQRLRTLSILKMRDTHHSPYIHDFELTKDGVLVKPIEVVV
jgi:KaiC/GvpD/RAD55 family RecA-like ATPase